MTWKSSDPRRIGVPFELLLQQSWLQSLFGWFSGSVTDDPERGMPGTGRIRGALRGLSVRFTKRMPVSYTIHEGRKVAVRDHLRDHGFDPGYDIPHPAIAYRGAFTSSDSASGTWCIPGGPLHVTSRFSIPIPRTTGTWTLSR